MRTLVLLILASTGCTVQLSPNEARFDDLTRRVAILEATKADAARTADALNGLSAEIEKAKPPPSARPSPTATPSPTPTP